MKPALFDTNILIDSMRGYAVALDELAYFDDKAVSIVTWMELSAGASDAAPQQEQAALRALLLDFKIIQLSDAIASKAAELRRASLAAGPKIALADAVIQATADITGRLMVTRNRRDFRGRNVRMPYELQVLTSIAVANIAPPPR